MQKKDITEKEDIVLLVNSFYEKVRKNPVLGYIFDEVAHIDWEQHLPKMYAFWGSILLSEHSYNGNPMTTHLSLSKRAPMTDEAFSEWISLFTRTIEENFEGVNAIIAKTRAENIARLMLYKIQMDQRFILSEPNE